MFRKADGYTESVQSFAKVIYAIDGVHEEDLNTKENVFRVQKYYIVEILLHLLPDVNRKKSFEGRSFSLSQNNAYGREFALFCSCL